jgi:hypothetical protein
MALPGDPIEGTEEEQVDQQDCVAVYEVHSNVEMAEGYVRFEIVEGELRKFEDSALWNASTEFEVDEAQDLSGKNSVAFCNRQKFDQGL